MEKLKIENKKTQFMWEKNRQKINEIIDWINQFEKREFLKKIKEELHAQTSNIGETLEADNSEGQVFSTDDINLIIESITLNNRLQGSYKAKLISKVLNVNKPVETTKRQPTKVCDCCKIREATTAKGMCSNCSPHW